MGNKRQTLWFSLILSGSSQSFVVNVYKQGYCVKKRHSKGFTEVGQILENVYTLWKNYTDDQFLSGLCDSISVCGPEEMSLNKEKLQISNELINTEASQ